MKHRSVEVNYLKFVIEIKMMQKESSILVLSQQTVYNILSYGENAFFSLIPKQVQLTIEYNRHLNTMIRHKAILYL